MLEFINYETVSKLILLFFSILLVIRSFKLRTKGILSVIVAVLIGISFMEAYNTQSNAKINLQRFKSAHSFICKAGDHNIYRVSQKDNWNIDGIYFIKNSLLIRADKCEEQ